MEGLSSEWIRVSEPSAHVLLIELCREPVNAFCTEFWKAYGELFERITREAHDIRAIVLSSAFPKIFSAGLDLEDAKDLAAPPSTKGDDSARAAIYLGNHVKEMQSAITAADQCPCPVIAAVHGVVVGLGVSMIAACDIRYAASNTKLAVKEVEVGLAAGTGSLAYLPKTTKNMSLIGEMVYAGRWLSAAEAEKIGFVSKVVGGGREEVVQAAFNLASDIARKSSSTVNGRKRLIMHARDHPVAENLEFSVIWNSSATQMKDIRHAAEREHAIKILRRESKL